MPRSAAYLLVSTTGLPVDQRRDAIATTGTITPDKAFTDTASGRAGSARPGSIECLNWLCDGDTLVVVAVDQLRRSIGEVAQPMHDLSGRKVAAPSLREEVDVSRSDRRAMALRALRRAREAA
jgi:DNA invertase Pin-like site-specific DNA recombinase